MLSLKERLAVTPPAVMFSVEIPAKLVGVHSRVAAVVPAGHVVVVVCANTLSPEMPASKETGGMAKSSVRNVPPPRCTVNQQGG